MPSSEKEKGEIQAVHKWLFNRCLEKAELHSNNLGLWEISKMFCVTGYIADNLQGKTL